MRLNLWIFILPALLSAESFEHFEKAVRPVLASRCFKCHGPEKQKSKLRLDHISFIRKGGEGGPVIVPGLPEQSRLIQALHYTNPDFQMPPKGKLSDQEIALMTRWIKEGARWPDEPVKAASVTNDGFKITDEDRAFWSFRPVKHSAPPEVINVDWPANAIDQFILAKLEQNNLKPSPDTDRYTLIRRVYLDMLGLPPTPEEIQKFVDGDPRDAFRNLVESVLQSPHYGERWARHWMDVVRYSETAGHVQDRVRSHAWKYRDYLIDAFNDDLPYDQFIREHLAGDLLPPRPGKRGETNVAPVATGFLWFHEMHFRPVDPVKQRADQVDAQIDIVGKAFLGLTLACARCHDHKFDPISQKDYYALSGFFHSTEERHVRTAPRKAVPGEIGKRANELDKRIAKAIASGVRAVRARQKNKTEKLVPVTETNFAKQPQIKKLRDSLAKLDPSSARWAPGAQDVAGQDVRLHLSGSHKRLGAVVARAMPELFNPKTPESFKGSGRLHLANCIADPENPLTARVMVNRLWHHHFGSGIVRTPSMFGRTGERPTHPKLLDYLAAEFVKSGWSLKQMHRLVLNSRTYRMSSITDERSAKIDPQNRLYQHANVRRMDAESLRDSLLAISGNLKREVHGASIPPFVSPFVTSNKPAHIPKAGPLDSHGRRSIYIMVRRNFITPFLRTFDFADPGESVACRNVTTVPAQALAMMNSPFVHNECERWAKNICSRPESIESKIKKMYLNALSRPPSVSELTDIMQWMGSSSKQKPEAHTGHEGIENDIMTWKHLAHVLVNTNDFIFIR